MRDIACGRLGSSMGEPMRLEHEAEDTKYHCAQGGINKASRFVTLMRKERYLHPVH